MVEERPLLGHGINLDATYRTPYYNRIGLADFSKKYEAHNMFLQTLSEGGAIGLTFFILWFAWHLRLAWRVDHRNGGPPIFTATFAAFLLAGLSQNSFQDGEVRLGLTIATAALWLVACQNGSMPYSGGSGLSKAVH